jgi:hypothetical protein
MRWFCNAFVAGDGFLQAPAKLLRLHALDNASRCARGSAPQVKTEESMYIGGGALVIILLIIILLLLL